MDDELRIIRESAEAAASRLKATFPGYANPTEFPAGSIDRRYANVANEVLELLDTIHESATPDAEREARVRLTGGKRTKSKKNRRTRRR
jgi:hypothetical protein